MGSFNFDCPKKHATRVCTCTCLLRLREPSWLQLRARGGLSRLRLRIWYRDSRKRVGDRGTGGGRRYRGPASSGGFAPPPPQFT